MKKKSSWLDHAVIRTIESRALLHVGVLSACVREKCITACINSRTQWTSVFAWEMHVIMIPYIRNDLTAQRATPPLVRVILSFKYLRNPPIFELCNNRNHSQHGSLVRIRFFFTFYFY